MNLLAILLVTGLGLMQEDYRLVREWGELLDGARLEILREEGSPVVYHYRFVHSACECSITRAIESTIPKDRKITTWAFDLSRFEEVKLLVGKPKDYNFEAVKADIWYIEIGTTDVLIQDTGFKSTQTATTNFGFHVEGLGARDRMIEATKRAIYTCGGKVSEVSISEE